MNQSCQNSWLKNIQKIIKKYLKNTKKIKIYVEIGQKVIINKYTGTEIKYENQEYIILKQDDILAIVE